MSGILGLLAILFIIFIIATVFNVAIYLFFVLLELIGAGVRKIIRSKKI